MSRRFFRIPDELAHRAAEMLRTQSSYDVAAALGIDRETVTRNARRLGVPIRPRGQPSLGVPTVWNPHKLRWPFSPRGVRPLEWAKEEAA